MANHYEVPSWAGKPPTGLHLDVLKGDKLIQKLMLDEKRCYLFGRNPQMNDFCIDHASCSRVHAVFVYHKRLDKGFLVDLGSTHGTYIGSMRLEANKPTQLPINSLFHFGASTRNYIIRERPSGNAGGIIDEISVDADGALLGLPETQNELDNLTEFNTAHNRRISMLGITTDDKKVASKRPLTALSGSATKKGKRGVSFNEDVDIINPEDIDPTIGRFRNLVKTTVVPMSDSGVKRLKLTTGDEAHSLRLQEMTKHMHPSAMPLTPLYSDLPAPSHIPQSPTTPTGLSLGGSMALLGSRLGLSLPNPAPDVDMYEDMRAPPLPPSLAPSDGAPNQPQSNEPKKKIYAKEAWPGRKPHLLTGV